MSLALILNCLVPIVGGYLNGTLVTRPNKPWFQTLQKPAGNPPAWLIAPVSTSLYAAMGYAAYLVWRDAVAEAAAAAPEVTTVGKWALAVYVAQLAVNQLWTPVFFGAHDLRASLYVISVLDALAIATTGLFFRCNRTAGWLLVPYLAWLGYATYLNASLDRLNPANQPIQWFGSNASAANKKDT